MTGLVFRRMMKIRHVVVRLTVVEIRNRETQAGVLHERVNDPMRVDVIGRLLFPSFRIGDDVVEVAVHDFANIFAGPIVDVRRGSHASARLVTESRYSRSFAASHRRAARSRVLSCRRARPVSST